MFQNKHFLWFLTMLSSVAQAMDNTANNVIPVLLNQACVDQSDVKIYDNQNDLYHAYNIDEFFSDKDPLLDEIAICQLQEFLEKEGTYKDRESSCVDVHSIRYVGAGPLSRAEVNDYKRITKKWAHALYKERGVLVREHLVSHDDGRFSVSRELSDIARTNGFNGSKFLTKQDAPLLYGLIGQFDNLFETTFASVSINNRGKFAVTDMGLSIDIDLAKHMTNEEIKCIVLHEYRHFHSEHLEKLGCLSSKLFYSQLDRGKAKKLWASFSRILERDADTSALDISNNPKVMISALLKSARFSANNKIGLKKDNPHPTYHERISYALARLMDS